MFKWESFSYYVRTPSKCEYMRTGGGGVISMRTFACNFFLIEHLVHELLTVVTRFPVLLKTSVLKKQYLVSA